VVSKVENRGRPSKRLVGLRPERVPAAGATITADGERVGEVTRAAHAPSLDAPAALALVSFDATERDLAVEIESAETPVAAPRASLPFVAGTGRSARLPTYDD
jgi:aminomethyltransferase